FAGISLAVQDVLDLRRAGVAAREVRARIADAGLAVGDIECVANWLPWHGGRAGPFPAMLTPLTPECGVALAAELDAHGLLLVDMAGATAEPGVEDQVVAAFADICDHAAAAGTIVHLEATSLGAIADFTTARRVVAAAGRRNGALTLDPWHFFRGGATLADLAGLPGTRIGAIQLCDGPLAPSGDPLHETTTARLLPGQGEFDLVGLVRAVDAIGARAPIGIEVFHRRQRTMTIAEIAGEWATAARAVLAGARAPMTGKSG
ncbi:MAG: sugar phosphate isomerase/epimerase, partial [Sphingomonadales bacterium]|nr:sugar phosphate isomerase/epimerase [Sphingomonadales bacterium]